MDNTLLAQKFRDLKLAQMQPYQYEGGKLAREMTHQTTTPIQQFEQNFPQAAQYGQDVASGRVATGESPYSFGGGLNRLAQTLQQASDDPTALLEYVGPGQMSSGLAGLAGMTAFHGSPHKFDKFSMKNIGTGEGAQAYGHGLYFAESPDVAGSYANKLSASPNEEYFAAGEKLSGIDKSVAYDIVFNGKDKAKIHARQNGGDFQKSFEKLKDVTVTRGNMYEVDIPDEHVANFLDWDAPLSEQPESVQKILKEKQKEWGESFGHGSDTYKQIGFNLRMQGLDDSPAAISKYMDSIGIKGIKYFDGSSRAVGEGTRNLVVFDEDIIKTLKRNSEELK